jgi:hemoglobin-like flavoprotein
MSLDIESLETSFDLLAPRSDELVDEFYARLFALAPDVRPMFSDDMTRQKAMLVSALVLVRKSLRDLDRLRPALHVLGARHLAYGAQPEHYPVVGMVLIEAMAVVAGDAWSGAYEQAWADALGVIAAAMIAGAEEAADAYGVAAAA